jgi:predicted transcriptional regulator
MIQRENIQLLNGLVSLLNLSLIESRIFLYLIRNGKSSVQRICLELELEHSLVTLALDGLVDRGMIFKLSSAEYRPFHPRFSVANCHRTNCQNLGIQPKMNNRIDALGKMLENYS